jgi:hypothetical protein
MIKYLRSSSVRKPFLIYDFASYPILISLYMRKIFLSFHLSVNGNLCLRGGAAVCCVCYYILKNSMCRNPYEKKYNLRFVYTCIYQSRMESENTPLPPYVAPGISITSVMEEAEIFAVVLFGSFPHSYVR